VTLFPDICLEQLSRITKNHSQDGRCTSRDLKCVSISTIWAVLFNNVGSFLPDWTLSWGDSSPKVSRRSEFFIPNNHLTSLSLSVIPTRTWLGSQCCTTYISKPLCECRRMFIYTLRCGACSFSQWTHLTGCSQRSRIFGQQLRGGSLEKIRQIYKFMPMVYYE
jgi:hypothetical protein